MPLIAKAILQVASACCLQGKNNIIGSPPSLLTVASACCLQGTNNLLTSKGMEFGEVKTEGGTHLLRGEKRREECKYFSQAKLLHNYLVISALQNLLFCIAKA